MSESNLEAEYKDAVNNFEERSIPITSSYRKAIERYADLEKRGLIQKQGSKLLPIEERYKPAFEYCQGGEDGQ